MMLSFAIIIVAGISGKVTNLVLQSNRMNFYYLWKINSFYNSINVHAQTLLPCRDTYFTRFSCLKKSLLMKTKSLMG
jgi:hypothetical protein